MPSRIQRPCSFPCCPNLVAQGRCDAHKRHEDDHRQSASKRGYDRHWRRFRAYYLSKHRLCIDCLSGKRVAGATEVHHITPLADDGDRLDEENLEALCKSCHSRKTQRETNSKTGGGVIDGGRTGVG